MGVACGEGLAIFVTRGRGHEILLFRCSGKPLQIVCYRSSYDSPNGRLMRRRFPQKYDGDRKVSFMVKNLWELAGNDGIVDQCRNR